MRTWVLRLIAFATVVGTTTARSEAAFLPTIDRGGYDSQNFRIVGNDNYYTGTLSGNMVSKDHHSFFIFNVAGISTSVTSATFTAYNPGIPSNPNNGYLNDQGFTSETLGLFEVSTPASTLSGGTGTPFTDLGSGTSYGSVTVSSNDNAQFVNVTLNVAGLAALNAARTGNGGNGSFVIGGAITTLSNASNGTEGVFGFTGSYNGNANSGTPNDGKTGLNYNTAADSGGGAVATPLPPTLLAGFAGFGLLAGVRRFRRA